MKFALGWSTQQVPIGLVHGAYRAYQAIHHDRKFGDRPIVRHHVEQNHQHFLRSDNDERGGQDESPGFDHLGNLLDKSAFLHRSSIMQAHAVCRLRNHHIVRVAFRDVRATEQLTGRDRHVTAHQDATLVR